MASTTPFSSAVSAPERLPSAVICTSPCLSPAFSITSTPIISPSDFGLLMPNFLPLRSAGVLSGELGITINTRSASERDVMPTILTSWPCSAAAMTGAAVTSPKPRSVAMALRTELPPPAPAMMSVMSSPCFLNMPFSSAIA